MNRLAVYSYLTRYTYGHAGSAMLFVCQKRAKKIFALKLDNQINKHDLKAALNEPESDKV